MRSNRVLSSAALLLILAIASLNAQNQEPPRVTFFPQLAVGGGAAGGFSCDFFITNQGIRAVDGVILRIFDNNGAPLVVQTQDFGATSTMEFNLAAGETRVIPITGGDAVVEGYAVLQCPRLSPVRSTVVVRAQTGGVVFTQLGVPEQHPFSHFSFAAEVRPGIGTGLALVNPAPSAQDLVISLIDQAGTLQGTKILTLQSGHHLALFLDDPRLFGAGLNFTGTATVSGADHFGLLALRLENANDPQNVVLGT
ncbi:MAG TPA: hypothetical protein PLP42_09715, partial [Acidobacteriota bacterium]|nr:hypothetical protein [Acidobacteriota bacterium]